MREIYVGLSMLAFTGVCYFLAGDITAATARIFPLIVIFSMFCFAVLQLARAIMVKIRSGAVAASCPPKLPIPRILFAVVLLFVYYLAIDTIGFYTSGLIFMTVCMLVFKGRKPTSRELLKAVGISAGFVVVIYIVFNQLLTVQTPIGLLM